MREHPKVLKNEGISEARYGELQAICRQYDQYLSGYGGQRGQQRAKLIKATAQAVARDDWPVMLEWVTRGCTFTELSEQPACPMNVFVRERLAFFILLHEEII